MKILMVIATFFCVSVISKAQDVFSNKVTAALEKVIQDYPNRFLNIRGELIEEGAQTAEYRSMVQLPGANSCKVTRHGSGNGEMYGWICTALQSPDFNLAKNKFKEIFGQIENTVVKIEGIKPFILNGQYEIPSEDKQVTSVLFDLLPSTGEIKKLKVLLSLQNIHQNWKVSLVVSDHDEKEEGQGAITGN